MARSVVLDTDPGVDDFLAIALALNSPEIEVKALTSVGGNAPLQATHRNARDILAALGRADIPVHRGAERPTNGEFGSAEHVHGEGGLPLSLPASTVPDPAEDAAEALARTAASADPPEIIALGPLTNLAALLTRYPQEALRIPRAYVMGGAISAPGNVTPHAEFNLWSDPEAAHAVFASGMPVTLVGIDVCRDVRLKRADAHARAPIVEDLLEAAYGLGHAHAEGITLYDPLTVIAACAPSLFTFRRSRVAVVNEDTRERGRTLERPDGGELDLAVKADVRAALDLFRVRVLEAEFPPAA